jgi:putative Holliday junction resolvase
MIDPLAPGWQSFAMRALGLDVGSKTIGVAVTDELGMAAHPVRTLARRGTERDVSQVMEIVREFSADRAIVGLPYEGDGTIGRRAERVRVFIAALRAAGLAVEECDERFSTVEAEETLLEADLSRKKRKGVIDRAAAVVILRRWLAHECT